MPTSPVLGGPEPLLLLLMAMVLDAWLGGTWLLARLVPSPATVVHRFAVDLDRRLNRIERGNINRMFRGLIVVILLVGTAAAFGWGLERIARTTRIGWLLELLAVMSALGIRIGWNRSHAVAAALETGPLSAAREAARPATFKQVYQMDEHGLARAAIEAAAKSLNQQVVTPVFWYVLGGLPGILGWTALNAVDAAIGHRSPRYAWFGLTAARLDDALNFLPARLSGLLIAVAALFVPRLHPFDALRMIGRFARKHRSLSGGWPEAAMAGALGVALSGPRREGEVLVREEWIGDGRARATANDVRRALALHAIVTLLTGGLVALLMLGLAAL